MKLLKEKVKGEKRDGYLVAAVAEIALVMPPEAIGKNKKVAWASWSEELRKAGLELAKAKAGPAQKKATEKLDTVCISCHNIFK